jgi:hypothetical protein
MNMRETILLLTGLLLFSTLPAQIPDSLPMPASGRIDWEPYKARAPKRFNQKDYAVYMVRVNEFHEIFETDPRQQWVDDFHFFDLNGDLMPDAVYSGETKYFKGERSMIMIGDSSLKYPITFSEPGYIHKLTPADSGLGITVISEPSGTDFRVSISRFFYDFAADSARLISRLQYISTTKVPAFHQPPTPFVLRRPTYLRTTPEVRNEPPIDYDQDERPDGTGNIVGELQPGLPLFRLWQEQVEGENWSFVILLEPPEGKHLFDISQQGKGVQGYAGWLPSGSIEE